MGILALALYGIMSYLRVKKKISTAVLFRDNIYQSEAVASPFVLGMIRPKIYLPFAMTGSEMLHVIAHEEAHIRRKDHWWKPLGFAILALHWFNPLLWLAYVLLCRDIEMACDEKVVKSLNTEERADYSQALLHCSVGRRMIASCPLAFGEVG
jgi:beta-lactamase regulating signal transducer with metallopeptidase domain